MPLEGALIVQQLQLDVMFYFFALIAVCQARNKLRSYFSLNIDKIELKTYWFYRTEQHESSTAFLEQQLSCRYTRNF